MHARVECNSNVRGSEREPLAHALYAGVARFAESADSTNTPPSTIAATSGFARSFVRAGSMASAAASVAPRTKELHAAMKRLAPAMRNSAHKGQAGRIGVIGGSK